MRQEKNKIIAVLGPTACGKTKLAVELARAFNGEIVSADSRQVYKGMDIGTGKDLSEYTVPYHLIDVANPKTRFDLAKYQRMAFAAIDDILKRGKIPILAGGSGLYMQAVVDNYKLSEVKENSALRKKSEKSSAEALFLKLKKLSPKIAARLNQSDKNNKRRLVRYLEILTQDENFKIGKGAKKYSALLIGVKFENDILKQRIFQRLIERLEKQNMIGEVEKLRRQGLSWKRLEEFGLEYRFIALHLLGKLPYDEMVEKLNIAIYQFAKRQLVWFRRWEKQGAKINWMKNEKKIEKFAREFLF